MARIEDRALAQLTAHQWHDIAKLRIDVFVVEQDCPYPELDGSDAEPATRHCWVPGEAAGLPDLPMAAYARALADRHGGTRIGRIVTHPSARGNGLGGLLVEHLLRTTTGPWSLDAQARLEGWYASFGFSAAGEPFDDWGMAHVPMRREASAGTPTPIP